MMQPKLETREKRETKDSLGDRMKMYEAIEAARQANPENFVIARYDGKAFHTFTRNFLRPFEIGLINLMGGGQNGLAGL